jgi:transposase
MQHAPEGTTSAPCPTQLPATPPGGLTAGLDWAKDDHVVCVVDVRSGAVRDRFSVEHTAAGLTAAVRRLAKLGCAEVAIERPDGPVVAELLEAGLTVVVISPNEVKNLRSRSGSAGNKDDRFDAYVLADTLRTDRARLRVLAPDSPATRTLRATCRARKDLVHTRVAVANQLRAHLDSVFPAAAVMFDEVDSPISLSFLTRFTCQGLADWLSPKRLAHWLRAVGYCGRTDPAVMHARLLAAPRGLTGEDGLARAHITRAYLATLKTVLRYIVWVTKGDGVGSLPAMR